MKKTLFTIFIVLAIVVIALVVFLEVSETEEVEVLTDKTEYGLDDSLRVKIENKSEDTLCFSGCYPYYFERKEGKWESYHYLPCPGEDSVDSCVEPFGTKAFRITLPEIRLGVHRLAIPACAACTRKSIFQRERWLYSNPFIIK